MFQGVEKENSYKKWVKLSNFFHLCKWIFSDSIPGKQGFKKCVT